MYVGLYCSRTISSVFVNQGRQGSYNNCSSFLFIIQLLYYLANILLLCKCGAQDMHELLWSKNITARNGRPDVISRVMQFEQSHIGPHQNFKICRITYIIITACRSQIRNVTNLLLAEPEALYTNIRVQLKCGAANNAQK